MEKSNSFGSGISPNYKGHEVGLEKAYSLFRNFIPNDWELTLSDVGLSEINYSTKTIELSLENWTEEVILYCIFTVTLFNWSEITKKLPLVDKDTKLKMEKSIWDLVKEHSQEWDNNSDLLRIRTLDWYESLHENSLASHFAFGIKI